MTWQHISKDKQSTSFSYILLARVFKNKGELDISFNYCSHGPRFFNFYNFTQVPEISEIMANLFGGGGSGGTSADKAKKKQKPHVTRRS